MKKKQKNILFYLLTIGVFSLLIYVTTILGNDLEYTLTGFESESVGSHLSAWTDFTIRLFHDMMSPLAILLLQIAVILVAVKVFGWLCQKIGQPSVVGEIIAGVVLGPSLLGLYFPDFSAYVFPKSSIGNIEFLSQIGLILFMFIVGMELNLRTIRKKADEAILISHASIVFPFALGFILAYFMYSEFSYIDVPFTSFAMFMGIAMSITAFPVLARIVHERGINKTQLGSIVITCAAIDDITAWCILAAVIAIVKAGSFTSSIFVILTAIAYVIFMFKVLRPFLRRLTEHTSSKRMMNKSALALYFLILFLSAYASEVIGIHALFGAFIAGVIMPTNFNFREKMTEKIEDIALIVFLPLFFVSTGLKTEIGLLNTPYLWMVCLIIILVATVGKFLGSALAARFVGQNWRDSLTIGVLMNTRGLMELVVLNIGYELGVLTTEVFTMLVVMALVTTFMTSPTLNLIDLIFKKSKKESDKEDSHMNVLVSFDDSDMGRKLLYLANCLIKRRPAQAKLTMLHISEGDFLYQTGLDEEEQDLFTPVLDEARGLNQEVTPIFKIANDISSSTVKYVNKGEFDILLIGHRKSLFSNNYLGRLVEFLNRVIHAPQMMTKLSNMKQVRKAITAPFDVSTRYIISKSDAAVGVLIDRDLILNVRNIFVPILDEDDTFVGEFMQRFAENSQVRITIWDSINLADRSIEFTNSIRKTRAVNPYMYQNWNNNIPIDVDILNQQDLILTSLNSWVKLSDMDENLADSAPSILVLTT